MASQGVVRVFHTEDGWGVIDGPDVPGGAWVHYSSIVTDGYGAFEAGQAVSFRWELFNQDGYARRVVRAWPGSGPEPAQPEPAQPEASLPDLREGIYYHSPPWGGGSTRPKRS